ncbi:MAG: hypothetical protein RLZZ210_1819, partial [Pseudomonadota bacterium]
MLTNWEDIAALTLLKLLLTLFKLEFVLAKLVPKTDNVLETPLNSELKFDNPSVTLLLKLSNDALIVVTFEFNVNKLADTSDKFALIIALFSPILFKVLLTLSNPLDTEDKLLDK